jgi:hypothetical protein
MDLLISANTVAKARADTAPVSGTPGWATDGDPAAGIPATDAPAWHYNMMMEELLAIVDAAGIAHSNTDWTQVLKALKTIFSPAQYGVAPYSAALATLIGGYPAGAIVYVSGAFWVSTVAANMTVPGVSGAKWKSLFDGYATQAWAAGQFVQTAPADASNAGAAYLGYRIDLGYAWLNYKNSAGAYVPIILADRAWVNGNFATLAGLATEASTRASVDTALSTAITNETIRAETAEASKGNLSGGNTWSGNQSVAGSFTTSGVASFGSAVGITGGGYLSIAENAGAGSMYMWPEYYASGKIAGLNAVTHLLDSNGNPLQWLALNGTNGSVWTGTGELAFVSQLPFADTTLKEQVFTQTQTPVSAPSSTSTVSFTFPTAFAPGTVPDVTLTIDNEPSGQWNYKPRVFSFARDANGIVVTNTGFTISVGVCAGADVWASYLPVTAQIRAVGKY